MECATKLERGQYFIQLASLKNLMRPLFKKLVLLTCPQGIMNHFQGAGSIQSDGSARIGDTPPIIMRILVGVI